MHDKGSDSASRAVERSADETSGGVAATSLYLAGRLRDVAMRRAQKVESRLLRELKTRLEALDGSGGGASGPDRQVAVRTRIRRTSRDLPGSEAGELLRALRERAIEQNADTAEAEHALRVVEQLVPDQARLLTGLSDGTPAAACHICAWSLINRTPIPVVEFASRIGVDAGVVLSERVPQYLMHMHSLGLIHTGPVDRSLGERYAMLDSETVVRDAVRYIEEDLGLRPRIVHFTIRASDFGRALWQASEADPGG